MKKSGSSLSSPLSEYKDMLYFCPRCNTCKYDFSSKTYKPTCPSGEKFLFEPYYASGRIRIARGILNGELEWSPSLAHKVFACTTCGNCTAQCKMPVGEKIIDIIEALREEAVRAKAGPLEPQSKFASYVEEKYNPYNEPHKDRRNWVPKPEISKLPRIAETIYFVGCTSSYRQKEIALVTLNVFEKAGLNFTLMSDEKCCGSPLLRTGQTETARRIAEDNLAQLEKAGAKRIVTTCAGCYRTLKKDYAEKLHLQYGLEILHTTELINQLIKEGKIKPRTEIRKKVTYHDPCHLGRHSKVYDPPRNILKQIPGVTFVEMPRNKASAWCCGSGGGVKAAFPDWAIEISRDRIKEAEGTGAEILTSTCPFCKRNLEDSARKYGSTLQGVMDVIELLNQSI
nr:(Fe-S)-binding protein [Candidatus Njordarchaeum guaymaensis]